MHECLDFGPASLALFAYFEYSLIIPVKIERCCSTIFVPFFKGSYFLLIGFLVSGAEAQGLPRSSKVRQRAEQGKREWQANHQGCSNR